MPSKMAIPLLAVCVTLFSVPASAADKNVIVGRATVIDGDTIDIQKNRIRLFGIDAPESRQICTKDNQKYLCGKDAAFALSDLLQDKNVKCTKEDTDRYGRTVGSCTVDQTDANKWMVANGWALAYRQYSQRYVADEEQAKLRKAGIWAGTFENPADFRKAKRAGNASKTQVSPTGCQIKGNINTKGEHIYHVPGDEAYDKTRITPKRGERWFCSEAEAKAAGWRPVH